MRQGVPHSHPLLNQLLGSWELESLTHYRENGEPYYPFGKDARGRLIYAGDGFVSAHLEAGAAVVSKDAQSNAATDQALIAVYGRFWSYCGWFEISGEKITHIVEMSNIALLAGTRQERTIRFDNNRLILTNERSALPNGRMESSVIIWKK